ncbi:MAG: GNAT family N-acetyltransferase [Dermatophilaceae bacterium]
MRPSKHRNPGIPAGGARMSHVTHQRLEAAHGAPVSVRVAVPADAPAVGTVQAASWRQAYAGRLAPEVLAGFEPTTFAAVWHRSLERPPTPRHRLLVACEGPDVVGLAAVGPCPDPDADDGVAEVLELAVHPQARGAGHGSRLLHAAADTAHRTGASVLAAWVPRDDEAVRGFLQRAGLVPDSAWRDRGVDDVGHRLREVRLVASLTDLGAPMPDTSRSAPRKD